MRARISRMGRVTIPAALRKRSGLLPGTEVDCWLEGEKVMLAPKGGRKGERNGPRMTTEEIMALMRKPRKSRQRDPG